MIYRFEDFTLDTDRRELRRGPAVLSIEPQVFDLLHYLVEHRDRLVTKDDLMSGVWGGRVVSESTLSSRITAVRQALHDSGEHQRIVKTITRKGFRFVAPVRLGEGQAGAPLTGAAISSRAPVAELSLPDKPSIIVLPFVNMSGDADQEYFADGITEDLIAALSQFRWFFVIARGSSFSHKGQSPDLKRIGRELGVRYVLEGSVRKLGNRLRITGQLAEAATAVQLWAGRFEGGIEDIFELQDRVTASVVGAVAPKLEQAEIERATRKPTESLDAYDYFLRGMARVHAWTQEGNAEAVRLFYKATDHDPDFASAYGMVARCYSQRKFNRWAADCAQEVAETERVARRAVEFGRDVPLALCTAGLGLGYVVGELDEGLRLVDRSLELNPNLAWAWLFGGYMKVLVGEPDQAFDRIERAIRLSPHDPHIFNMQGVIASAHFFSGRLADAASWADKALQDHPNHLFANTIAAAAKALLGEAADATKTMTRLRQLDPQLRVSNLQALFAPRRTNDFERWAEGLRLAGLPA